MCSSDEKGGLGPRLSGCRALGCRVWGSELGVKALGTRVCGVWGLDFGVGLRVSRVRVQGLGRGFRQALMPKAPTAVPF